MCRLLFHDLFLEYLTIFSKWKMKRLINSAISNSVMSGFLHCWVPLGYWFRFLVLPDKQTSKNWSWTGFSANSACSRKSKKTWQCTSLKSTRLRSDPRWSPSSGKLLNWWNSHDELECSKIQWSHAKMSKLLIWTDPWRDNVDQRWNSRKSVGTHQNLNPKWWLILPKLCNSSMYRCFPRE